MSTISRQRIYAARNQGVYDARERNASHLLFMDPDISMDRYVLMRESWAKPWWETAWPCMQEHPGCVVACPYVGQSHSKPVFVFQAIPGETGKIQRIPYEEAAERTGWERVAAVGTGLMLMDMSIFGKLSEPYFDEVCTDRSKRNVEITPDVYFCLQCSDADIPIWVNWDLWCGHWQNQVVEAPRLSYVRKGLESIGRGGQPQTPPGRLGLRSPSMAVRTVRHPESIADMGGGSQASGDAGGGDGGASGDGGGGDAGGVRPAEVCSTPAG